MDFSLKADLFYRKNMETNVFRVKKNRKKAEWKKKKEACMQGAKDIHPDAYGQEL